MFCPKCGKQIPDGSAFCPMCGQAVSVTASSSASASGVKNGTADKLKSLTQRYNAAYLFQDADRFLSAASDALPDEESMLEAMAKSVGGRTGSVIREKLNSGEKNFDYRTLLTPLIVQDAGVSNEFAGEIAGYLAGMAGFTCADVSAPARPQSPETVPAGPERERIAGPVSPAVNDAPGKAGQPSESGKQSIPVAGRAFHPAEEPVRGSGAKAVFIGLCVLCLLWCFLDHDMVQYLLLRLPGKGFWSTLTASAGTGILNLIPILLLDVPLVLCGAKLSKNDESGGKGRIAVLAVVAVSLILRVLAGLNVPLLPALAGWMLPVIPCAVTLVMSKNEKGAKISALVWAAAGVLSVILTVIASGYRVTFSGNESARFMGLSYYWFSKNWIYNTFLSSKVFYGNTAGYAGAFLHPFSYAIVCITAAAGCLLPKRKR